MDALIARTSKENDACQRLTSIPGVGPVTATALVAAIGNGSAFRKGRDLSAWVGLVPGEYTTGGKQKLLGISKWWNWIHRQAFVQCARSIIRLREKERAPFGAWLRPLMSHAHQNVAVVALANKLLRIAWAVLFRNQNIFGARCQCLLDSKPGNDTARSAGGVEDGITVEPAASKPDIGSGLRGQNS